jgi:hypothetical protein
MIYETLHNLGVITIINFIVVFSFTLTCLYLYDKIKEKFGKKDKDK